VIGTPTVADVLQGVNSALAGCPIVAHYRLTEGSTIAYYAGTPTPSVEEPLSGTFALVGRGYEPQFFDYQITSLDFQSAHFTLTGGATAAVGCAMVDGLPPNVIFSATALVNADSVFLSGDRGSANCCPPPPQAWSAVEICGAAQTVATCEDVQTRGVTGYRLTIFAAREN
jgi:hypothetical protein